MIITVWSWVCTQCGHSKRYDPEKTTPPDTCPACSEGGGYSYKDLSKGER